MVDLDFILLIFPVWAGAILTTTFLTGTGSFIVLGRIFIAIFFSTFVICRGLLISGEGALLGDFPASGADVACGVLLVPFWAAIGARLPSAGLKSFLGRFEWIKIFKKSTTYLPLSGTLVGLCPPDVFAVG